MSQILGQGLGIEEEDDDPFDCERIAEEGAENINEINTPSSGKKSFSMARRLSVVLPKHLKVFDNDQN